MNGKKPISTNYWMPLIDYAIKRKISLSTLRRHIKAKKLIYKVENGRYLIWDKDEDLGDADFNSGTNSETNRELKNDLQKALEEIAELKTLIAFYEEKIPQNGINQ